MMLRGEAPSGLREGVRERREAHQDRDAGEDLERFSREYDALLKSAGVCVVGGKAAIDACGEMLDTIEALQ